MTHAKRGRQCEFCDKIAYGNGGKVAHARSHVRRSEAVELEKWFGGISGMGRVFIAAHDEQEIAKWIERGYEVVR